MDKSGTAFPLIAHCPTDKAGLTKLEYFAAMAMQGIIASCQNKERLFDYDEVARQNGIDVNQVISVSAFEIADAMLEESKKLTEDI